MYDYKTTDNINGDSYVFQILSDNIKDGESLVPACLPEVRRIFESAISCDNVEGVKYYLLLTNPFRHDPEYKVGDGIETLEKLNPYFKSGESLRRLDKENKSSLLRICDNVCAIEDQNNFERIFHD